MQARESSPASREGLLKGKLPAVTDEAARSPEERHGEDAADVRQDTAQSGASGWVTTEVAAAALRVSPRTVRDYVRAGDLEAISQGKGVRKRWLVSIDAVQAMRDQRQNSGEMPRSRRGVTAGDTALAAGTVDAADLVATVQELQYRLGRAEARAELQAVAESTVREERDRLLAQLEEARVRAQAERERADMLDDELREARKPPPELRNYPESVGGGSGRDGGDTPDEDTGVPQASIKPSWWRRFFGFE